jgi:hypothetical protein
MDKSIVVPLFLVFLLSLFVCFACFLASSIFLSVPFRCWRHCSQYSYECVYEWNVTADTKDSVRRSRHLGEWNQFRGQAVSTFRSQTLGPHVTHLLLCCYSMSGSVHLDTWQRGTLEVVTY